MIGGMIMKRDYIIKENEIIMTQKAINKNGEVVAIREVRIPPSKIQEQNQLFREFVQTTAGADPKISIVYAIDALLDSIKKAQSPYEVQVLGAQLNQNIELKKIMAL